MDERPLAEPLDRLVSGAVSATQACAHGVKVIDIDNGFGATPVAHGVVRTRT